MVNDIKNVLSIRTLASVIGSYSVHIHYYPSIKGSGQDDPPLSPPWIPALLSGPHTVIPLPCRRFSLEIHTKLRSITKLCMYVYMYVCMYVCMYRGRCLLASQPLRSYSWRHVLAYIHTYIHTYKIISYILSAYPFFICICGSVNN